MGYVIGTKSFIGGSKQPSLFDLPKPKTRVTEVKINGGGTFLIREDAADLFSVVFPNDPWGEPIVQGKDKFEAADKMDHVWKEQKAC